MGHRCLSRLRFLRSVDRHGPERKYGRAERRKLRNGPYLPSEIAPGQFPLLPCRFG